MLQNVNVLRKTPLITPYSALEWVANGGECVYYFTEQFTWWVQGQLLGRVKLSQAGGCRVALVQQRRRAMAPESWPRESLAVSGAASFKPCIAGFLSACAAPILVCAR